MLDELAWKFSARYIQCRCTWFLSLMQLSNKVTSFDLWTICIQGSKWKKYQHNTIIVLKTDCYCTQREEDMAPLLIYELTTNPIYLKTIIVVHMQNWLTKTLPSAHNNWQAKYVLDGACSMVLLFKERNGHKERHINYYRGVGAMYYANITVALTKCMQDKDSKH